VAAVRGVELWSTGGKKEPARLRVKAKTTDASLMPIVCPTCGATNPPNAIVCKKCASPL